MSAAFSFFFGWAFWGDCFAFVFSGSESVILSNKAWDGWEVIHTDDGPA